MRSREIVMDRVLPCRNIYVLRHGEYSWYDGMIIIVSNVSIVNAILHGTSRNYLSIEYWAT